MYNELISAVCVTRKMEGVEPVVGSDPAPTVSSEQFYDVAIDFKSSQKVDAALVVPAENQTDQEAEVSRETNDVMFNFQFEGMDSAEPVDQKSTLPGAEIGDSKHSGNSKSVNLLCPALYKSR